MKVNSILFAALFLLGMPAQAQNKIQHYIGISVSASAPMGDFAKAETGTLNNWNNTAGYAKSGFAVGLEGAYYFAPKIGLAGTLYFSDHGGFSKDDAAKLGESYTDAFAVAESTINTTKRYQSINIMVGPQFSFPANKFTFDVRVLAGVIKSLSTPAITVQLEDNTDTPLRQLSSTAVAFGWQVGGGLRYALSDKLGLLVRADYFNSAGVAIDNQNRFNNAGRLVTTQPLSWLNGSIGLSLNLGK